MPSEQIIQREHLPPIKLPRGSKPYLSTHKGEFPKLLAPPPGYDADDYMLQFNGIRFNWMAAFHAAYSPDLGCLAAFEKERCALAGAPLATPPSPPSPRPCSSSCAHCLCAHSPALSGPHPPLSLRCSARKVLDNDIFNLLGLSARMNLGRLSATVMSIFAHLQINGDRYGEMDSFWNVSYLEHLQVWLMDAEACPTTWPTLLRIRRENPQFSPAR